MSRPCADTPLSYTHTQVTTRHRPQSRATPRRSSTKQLRNLPASSSAYGDNPVPWIEHMPVRAKSPYAANKVADEALMSAYSNAYGLDTCCTRYFNIFGPRQNANSAYAAVIAAFASSGKSAWGISNSSSVVEMPQSSISAPTASTAR